MGERILRLFEDLTSCGGALSATFGGFYVGEGRGFVKPPDGHPHLSTQSGTKGLPPPALHV